MVPDCFLSLVGLRNSHAVELHSSWCEEGEAETLQGRQNLLPIILPTLLGGKVVN